MNKKLFLLFIVIMIVFSACSNQDKENFSENEIVKSFAKQNIIGMIEDFPKSRSENFPFNQIPKVLKVGNEEIFIFSYSNEKMAEKEFFSNQLNEEGEFYQRKNVIFLYRGDNIDIINALENICHS